MDKSKFFVTVITVAISAIILFVIINRIFNVSNGINQGDFRVSDAIVTSIVKLEDKSEESNQWKFDISQSNKISMLLQTSNNAKIKEVYLDNFKISSKNDVSIYVEQDKYDYEYKYENIKNKKVNIYAEENEEGNYLIEFDITNEDILSNYIVPDDVKEIRYDGTILNIAKIPVSKILFKAKYDLVVVENNGQINTCKVEINMPDGKIVSEGLSVERIDITNFNFKVNY